MSIIKLISDREKSLSVAKHLLNIGAIKLKPDNPFTWSSGWKSPIYCDNRLSLSYPETRSLIKSLLAESVRDAFPGTASIAGVATAGIPQGALIADELELPYLYVRSKPKGHGMENMIEGKITVGQKIVLVEDLVSTGGSSLKAAEALQTAGFEVLGMVAIFTYGFELAESNFKKAGIPLICLCDYNTLIDAALEKNLISESHLELLNDWRLNPEQWKAEVL